MYTKDLDRHDWPVFRSGDMSYSKTWPANDIGVANVLVPVDPLLKTKVLPSKILIDVDVGWEDLVLIVWGDKHLMTSVIAGSPVSVRAYIMSGKRCSVIDQGSGLSEHRWHILRHFAHSAYFLYRKQNGLLILYPTLPPLQ